MNNNINLGKDMAHGLKWTGFGQISGHIIRLAVWTILARLLLPDDFGALSVAMIFSNLPIVFNELGMSTAIIQRRDLTKEHIVSTFWICFFIGAFFLLVSVFAASFIADFYKKGIISRLIIAFAFKNFFDSLSIVPESLLKREMLFKKIALIEITSNIMYCFAAIIMVLKGAGIMSIVWGYLIASMIKLFLLFWGKDAFRPYFGFDAASSKELFDFGKNILGFKIVSYFTGSIDVYLIGKILGAVTLGYYSLASSLANFSRQKLSFLISTIAFPAFSKIQDDIQRLKEAYLRIIRYAAVVNFPLLIGLMLLSPKFVHLVYTSKWDGMILPLRILCVYGISFSLTTFVGNVFNATGHPDYSFKFCLINLAGVIIAILSGLKSGLVGISIALSLYAVIMNIIGHLMVGKIIEMKFISYLESLVPALAASSIMSLGILMFLWIQENLFMFSDILFLPAAVIFGAVIYTFSLFLFSRQTFKEILEIGSNLFK